jgi:hypothetical protein
VVASAQIGLGRSQLPLKKTNGPAQDRIGVFGRERGKIGKRMIDGPEIFSVGVQKGWRPFLKPEPAIIFPNLIREV